ncbi:pyridoxamine 5'-phosphate oxidase [Spongisporangium articulatum]|uniref:Pyridoxine/pyridoxamine 5'-phosphate oxidase n=1 Tax=Spongisporangium articulatum TaxID=3362603 RepID=A0ABW8AGW9_9ACTN
MLDPTLSQQRESYDSSAFLEADLRPDPLAQFRDWYAAARAAGVREPNAMTLATVGLDGGPTARTVLLKDAEPEGFSFFTNLMSRKGQELGVTRAAALVLPWLALNRQVSVRGRVELLPRPVVAEYFRSRPYGSRIGAWVSHQSQPTTHGELEARYAELSARWPDTGRPDDVPVPDHWGGYLVRPTEVEFWQGRPSRLHDRLVYVLRSGSGSGSDSGSGSGSDSGSAAGSAGEPPSLADASAWSVVRRSP